MTGDRILTVREAVAKAAAYFSEKGVCSARLDAELLIGAAVGMDRLHVYMNMDRPLNVSERDRAREFLRRRGAREPVAYILGHKEFLSRDFEVTPAVLVPRPETELLVECAEQELTGRFPEGEAVLRVLEFGVGSGVIAVSLAADIPRVDVLATETSPAAAAVAERNAVRHGVAGRVHVRVQSDFEGIAGPFHAIVSNPPYVAERDRADLPPEVRDFEPEQALFAGLDGMRWLDLLLREAPRRLLPGGFLLVEIGEGMTRQITQAADSSGLRIDRVVRDYAGIERHVLLVP